jgi:predicted transcriptional regulator
MATLGNLERTIMDVLWDTGAELSANDVRTRLAEIAAREDDGKELALTTVLTVLGRLEAKGFVRRDRDSRPHLFGPEMSRSEYMAELMHEVLGSAHDRTAVLARFVGGVSPDEAAQLRKLLDGR